MNEFDVIRRLSEHLPTPPPEVVVPVGDDCAVLRFGDALWVAAADMLVEGRHFKEWASPEDVGYKAVAVNVSDVAAMGGVPRFVLASGGAEDVETALRCMEGVLRACEEFGVYPLGRRANGGRLDPGRARPRAGAALRGPSRRPSGRDRRARGLRGGSTGSQKRRP